MKNWTAEPRNGGEWNYIQLAASHRWCYPGLSMGPVLFNSFNNDLDQGIKCTLRQHQVSRRVDLLKGRKALQRALGRLV